MRGLVSWYTYVCSFTYVPFALRNSDDDIVLPPPEAESDAVNEPHDVEEVRGLGLLSTASTVASYLQHAAAHAASRWKHHIS